MVIFRTIRRLPLQGSGKAYRMLLALEDLLRGARAALRHPDRVPGRPTRGSHLPPRLRQRTSSACSSLLPRWESAVVVPGKPRERCSSLGRGLKNFAGYIELPPCPEGPPKPAQRVALALTTATPVRRRS